MALFSTNPAHIAAFSQRTEQSKPTMQNVWAIPKKEKCVDCGVRRTEATGIYKKRVFVCGMCK